MWWLLSAGELGEPPKALTELIANTAPRAIVAKCAADKSNSGDCRCQSEPEFMVRGEILCHHVAFARAFRKLYGQRFQIELQPSLLLFVVKRGRRPGPGNI
jgi:hypothetical protein